MKNQGNRKGGIMLVIFSLIFAITIGSIIVIVYFTQTNMGLEWNNTILPLFLPIIFLLVPLGFGIGMIISGNKSVKVKKEGRKTTCVIYNIIRIKNGYQMVVDYRGESGAEYKHALYISQQEACLFKAGMKIECYVQGEDCYVDEGHIVEVKDDYDPYNENE